MHVDIHCIQSPITAALHCSLKDMQPTHGHPLVRYIAILVVYAVLRRRGRLCAQILARQGRVGHDARGIPVGGLVTPLPVGAPAPPVLPRQPVSCRQCSAYVNCYCEVGAGTGALALLQH